MAAYISFIKNGSVGLKCIESNLPNGLIFINEHLKTSTLRLFIKARNLVREKKYWKASIRRNNVTIQIRRGSNPIIIRTFNDLVKLSNSDNSNLKSTISNDAAETVKTFHVEENYERIRSSTPTEDATVTDPTSSFMIHSTDKNSKLHTQIQNLNAL